MPFDKIELLLFIGENQFGGFMGSKILRSSIKVLLTAMLLIVFNSCNSSLFSKGSKSKNSETLLFVLHSGLGQFQAQTAGSVPSQLVLNKINTSVAFFSNRPDRDSGTQSLNAFLSNWNHGQGDFAKNPPNAALVYYRAAQSSDEVKNTFSEVNLVLKNPLYNASLDQLTFDIELVDQRMSLPAGQLIETTLFIDQLFFPGGGFPG